MSRASPPARAPTALPPRVLLGALAAFVAALTLYANASYRVEDPDAYRYFPPFVAGADENLNQHLGAEYFHIARALAAGRGFSDPFAVPTGPTAWMPPVYPALLAGLWLVTGSRAGVAAIVVTLKGVVLVLTGALILAGARRTALRLRPDLALAFYGLWLVCHFPWFFQITHDTWLVLALVDGVLLGAWRLLERGVDRRRSLAWGAWGGLALLTSPVAGGAWAATALWVGWRRRAWRYAALSLAVAAAIGSVWVARNVAVFDEWILVKSNLAFDLYQSTYVDDDGVYDEELFARHPVWTLVRSPGSLYRREGEAAFLVDVRSRLAAALRAHPEVWLERAGQRLLAATLVYPPYRVRYEGRHPPLATALHPLPLLGLLVALALRRGPAPETLRAAALFYAVYLAPYVLVAFYLRYWLPLTPALIAFVFSGADALAARRRQGGPAAGR